MRRGIVALVPARGGSKGLPGKNIRPLAGKPLIAWTLETALASGLADNVIVSTDDPAIAAVAREQGAEVPFLRPAELACDDSTTLSAVLHALAWLEQHATLPRALLLLQPTSPLRLPGDIAGAVDLFETSGADAVVSVCEARTHPYLVQRLAADGSLTNFVDSDLAGARRQDLPAAYQYNGAIYLNRVDSLRSEQTFFPQGRRPYVMPAERSLDIDTAADFRLAELLLHRA